MRHIGIALDWVPTKAKSMQRMVVTETKLWVIVVGHVYAPPPCVLDQITYVRPYDRRRWIQVTS